MGSRMTIWFTITTVISVLMMVVMYFGYLRYAQLHIYSVESYAKNYSKLPRAVEDNKVVVSFSATPEQVKKLKPLVNSLLDQTVKVDQIGVSVPSGSGVKIPEKYDIVLNTFRCGKDYGECNKTIPVLLRERDGDTIVIIVKNGYVYGKDMIETLCEQSKEKMDSAIITKCGRAMLVKPRFFSADILDKDEETVSDEWLMGRLTSPVEYVSISETYGVM